MDSNALASSIVLVCRPRAADAPTATRREFVTALKAELPVALAHLQRGNIAPVDLAQAAIGPGMAVYTRYAKVLDAEGKPLSVREALALINQTLDEALAEQEGDFDADSRWALAWFEQSGFAEGEYGVAETLSKAKNTSVAGMVEAGILASRRGKVRLLKPERTACRLGPDDRPAPHGVGDGPPPDPRARSGRRRRRGGARREARRQGRDRPRARLPPLHPLRAQEARGRGACLQRPGAELAGDHPPGPRGRHAARRRRPRLFERTRNNPWPSPTTSASARRWSCSRTGLRPFVEREFKSVYKDERWPRGARLSGRRPPAARARPIAEWDVAALLKLMWDVLERRLPHDAGPGRAQPGQRAARRAQPLGAPGAVLQRRRLPRARLRRRGC